MLRKIEKGLFDILVHISVYVLKIEFINDLLKPGSRLRKALVNVRKITGSLFLGEICCEADIYGTKIKIIDDRTLDYYYHFSRGEIYEPALTLHLKKLLEEFNSSTFIDIGAHYGYFTIYAGKLLGSRGQIISIEPHPKFYHRLLQNIKINGLNESVKTFNIALSDKEGKAQMGGFDERCSQEVERGNVNVITLDMLREKENIPPSIIKIDVHGSEGKVLSGMSNTLKNDVFHLFCELHDDMQGYSVRTIIQILENAGLEVLELTKHRGKSGGDIVPISEDLYANHNDRMLYARRKSN